MPTTPIVVDGLWRCLCPSFQPASVAGRIPRCTPRPRRPPPRASATLRQARHASTADARRNEHRPEQTELRESLFLPIATGPVAAWFPRALADASTETLYHRLRSGAGRGDIKWVTTCVEYLVKERQEQPNLRLYNALILANVSPEEGSAARVDALLEEMRDEGLEPDSGVCHCVLKVLAIHPDYLLREDMVEYMRERWFGISSDGLHDVTVAMLREGQYELALDRIDAMVQDGVPVQSWLYDMAIYMLGEVGEIDEAFRLISSRTNEPNISPDLWYHLLDAASSAYHYDATSYIWLKRVQPSYLNPSSGLCLNVLTTAARHGDAHLATEVFRILANRNTVFTHAHYELLIDTYIAVGSLEPALSVLCVMEAAGCRPDEGTTRSLFRHLVKEEGNAGDAFEALRKLHGTGKTVPTAAVNVVIEASVSRGELARAADQYKALHGICAAGPNTATFNHLLRGCRTQQRKDLAMFFAAEMVALRVTPDVLTYDRLLLVCLADDDYEDAVRYWDEMQSLGLPMRRGTAKAFIERMVRKGDPRAWSIVSEDGRAREGMEGLLAWLEKEWQVGMVGSEEAARMAPVRRVGSTAH